jgi:hypothetical protein
MMVVRHFAALLLLFVSCASVKPEPSRVEATLDTFHQAAASADEEAYFECIAPNGVFIGTDATERWSKDAFRAYAHPYFSAGRGWTFRPRDRNVAFSSDGRTAWFDERLDSATYGECRGTGVLQLHDGRWLIEQYHLTIPIPNALAKDLVERIRAAK